MLQANEERQARRDREDAVGRDATRGLPACNRRIESPRKRLSPRVSSRLSVYLLYSFLGFKLTSRGGGTGGGGLTSLQKRESENHDALLPAESECGLNK